RASLLFSCFPLELGDRRRRRPDRLAPPADRPRLRRARHLRQRQGVLLFRACRVRRLRRRDGEAHRLSIRALAHRHSRERAARALPRRAGRVSHLALLRDLLPVRQRGGRALRASQQFHRSARAALRPLRQSGDHGGAGRHALVLGAADRRGDLRRAAGLRLQPHRELDVGDRSRLCAGGALLSARGSGHAAQRGQGVTLLQVEGASKRFGNLVAIDDVSLTIEPGELRAIIGPNGAGKTTFFNLVSGLFAPTSGAILFNGRDVTGLAPEQRVAHGMARTFQITEIFPELSVAENIRVAVEIAAGYRLSPWLGRAARAGVAERVAELLAMGGLLEKKNTRVGALSHGDQRAAEIMMSLALRPRLLMLDE